MKKVFLTLITVLFVFTSCQKEGDSIEKPLSEIEQASLSDTPNYSEIEIFIRPAKGFETKSDKQKQIFFEQLAEDQIEKLQENYRIAQYLQSIDYLEKIEKNLKEGQLLTDTNLNEILSQEQKQNLLNFSPINQRSGCILNWTDYCIPYWCSGPTLVRVWEYLCNGNFIDYAMTCQYPCSFQP